jgi:hypothetical protein
MFIIITSAVSTAILVAVVLRFVGAFLRDLETSDMALPAGLLTAMVTCIGGLALQKGLGHASWFYMFIPVLAAFGFTILGAVIFAIFKAVEWITTGVDALANRGREAAEEYHFHRNLDQDQ